MKNTKAYKVYLTNDKSIIIHAEDVDVYSQMIEFYNGGADPIAIFTIENIRGFILMECEQNDSETEIEDKK